MRKSVLFFLFCLCNVAFAQEYSPYFTLDQYKKYTDYLISSGKLKITHPLDQPFVANELSDSLSEAATGFDRHWLGLLNKDLGKYATSGDSMNQYGKLIAGADAGYRGNYEQEKWSDEFYGSPFASFGYRNFGLFYRFEADQAFKSDSAYFGSTGKLENPIYYRTAEAYLKWDIKNVSLFIGRSPINCGIMNEPSLILSDNPLSYDRIGLIFTNRALKFTTFLSRLDDIYGFDIRDSIPVYAWNKRYLAMHRFEISVTRKIEFAFTETMLFGGEDQNVLFQYINPANIFYISKLGERKGYEEGDANAFASFEVYYKPIKKLTLFGQFLIDDMDFTKELREQFPDRIGFSGKMVISDLWPGSQVFLTYNRISNWTYNSFYTFGNYIYYGKGLGYPKNGDENLTLGMDVFRFAPVMSSLQVKWEREREQDLQGPYIAEKTEFPIGIAQQSMGVDLNITYFPITYMTASLDLQYIQYANFEHVEGNDKGFFNIMFKLKATGILTLLNK
jgi:hypothetical protein